jgi:hypothetical protein
MFVNGLAVMVPLFNSVQVFVTGVSARLVVAQSL